MVGSSVLFRADATTSMGTGHVMRCLALAQAWQDAGGRAIFASAELPAFLEQRLTTEGCQVEKIAAPAGTPADIIELAAVADRTQAEWVVLDGYHFGSDFQQALKDAGRRVLAIDDYGHVNRYPADLVLNQNLGADESLYTDRDPNTRLLLGPRFALLRWEFTAAAGWQREVPDIGRKVLVTLGGADPDNVSLTVIEALGRVQVEGLEAVVVVGGSNPYRAELEAAAQQSPARIDLRVNVTDMPALMRWADVAVAAGGTTTWERAVLGLSGLILVVAENQVGIAAACDALGLGWNLGWHADITAAKMAKSLYQLMCDPAARSAMAVAGRQAVDGRGAKRVVRQLLGPATVRIRVATAHDARRLWEWANDPITRSASFNSAAIPWEDHARWFAEKLIDPGCVFLIAEDGVPVGQVRFDVTDTEAMISVGLAPEVRGCGYGTAVIRSAVETLFRCRQVGRINAMIRPENQASIRAFSAAGFAAAGEATVLGNSALKYVLTR